MARSAVFICLFNPSLSKSLLETFYLIPFASASNASALSRSGLDRLSNLMHPRLDWATRADPPSYRRLASSASTFFKTSLTVRFSVLQRCSEVETELFDLFALLGATDEQLDFPVLYASAKEGWVTPRLPSAEDPLRPEERSMGPLLDCILQHVPPPAGDPGGPFKMLVRARKVDQTGM